MTEKELQNLSTQKQECRTNSKADNIDSVVPRLADTMNSLNYYPQYNRESQRE